MSAQGQTSPPFVTRRSTIGFSMAYFVGLVLFDLTQNAPGSLGDALAAICFAIAAVTVLVAWINGMVLALRGHSTLWFIVVLLFPPFGSVGCALFSKKP